MKIYQSEQYGSLYVIENSELVQIPMSQHEQLLSTKDGAAVDFNAISPDEAIELNRIKAILTSF